MSLNKVPSGRDVPNDFNVIIEIPMNADPIKYEVDKESGAIFVDRFMGTAMHYPCNYGYVPNTLSDATDARMVRESHLKLAQMHEALSQSEEAANHYRQCALATIL